MVTTKIILLDCAFENIRSHVSPKPGDVRKHRVVKSREVLEPLLERKHIIKVLLDNPETMSVKFRQS